MDKEAWGALMDLVVDLKNRELEGVNAAPNEFVAMKHLFRSVGIGAVLNELRLPALDK